MSVPLYNRVKDYFIARDAISPDFIRSECGKKLSRKQLNRYFDMNIKKHDVHKYRILFSEKCTKKLKDFAEATRTGGDFWKMLYSTVMTERIFYFNSTIAWVNHLELFLNVIWYLGSLYFPWSTYLLVYPGGKKMLKNLFEKPSTEGLLSLYCIIYTIQTRKQFDDLFFQEEIVRLIPHLNLPSSVLRKFGFQEVPTVASWYQYITLNLVSEQSMHQAGTIVDSKLTTYVLTELLTYLKQLLEKSGAGLFLMEMLQAIDDQAKPSRSRRSEETIRLSSDSPDLSSSFKSKSTH